MSALKKILHPDYSIRVRLIMWIILPVVLLFLVFNFMSLKVGTDFTSGMLKKAMENVAWRFASDINSRVNRAIDIGIVKAIEYSQMTVKNESELIKKLQHDIELDSAIFSAGLIFENENKNNKEPFKIFLSKTYNKINIFKKENTNRYLSDTIMDYEELKKTHKYTISEPYINSQNDSIPSCLLSIPLFFENKFRGAYFLEVSLRELTKNIRFKDSTVKSFGFIVISKKGKLVYHPTLSRVAKDDMFYRGGSSIDDRKRYGIKMMQGFSGVDYLRTDNNTRILWVFYAPIEAAGWSINASIDEKDALKELTNQSYLAYILLVLTTVIMIVLMHYTSKKITSPISSLTLAVHEISRGNWDQKIEISSKDEVGELAATFEKMKIELKKRENEILTLNSQLETRISERTEELLEAKQSAEAIVDSSPIPTAVLNIKTGEFLRVNKSMTDFALVSIQDFQKYTSKNFYYHPDEQQIILKIMGKDGKLENYEIKLKRIGNDELAWGLLSIYPIKYERQDLHVISIIDITAIKNFQKDLEQAKNEAESANKAKSEFLANVSHEIRTPLNAIMGYSELLLSRAIEPEMKNHSASIIKSADSLLVIINDILDISRIESGQYNNNPEYCNIINMIYDYKNMFSQKIIEIGLDFVCEITNDFPDEVWIDSEKIRKVLLNLINNAIKFTEKGYIKIFASSKYLNPERTESEITIVIEDSGIGIASEKLQRISQPFEQGDGQSNRKYGGTGLGLAISFRLMKILNGSILIESQVGKGSKFYLKFPFLKVKTGKSILTEISINESLEQKNDEALNLEQRDALFDPEKISELLDLLENKFYQEWQTVSKTKQMAHIKQFTNSLNEISKDYPVKELLQFCNELNEAVSSLKVIKIKNLLAEYPKIIEKIK